MTAVKNAPPAKEVSDLTEVQAPRQIKRGFQAAPAWFIDRYADRYRFYHAPSTSRRWITSASVI